MNSASIKKAFTRRLRFNKTCVICRQASKKLICSYCIHDLPLFDLQQCDGNLLNMPLVRRSLPDTPFETLLALGDYQWPISKLISGLKFNNRVLNAKALADLFIDKCLTYRTRFPKCILPVPLGNERFSQRKYNQSYELAKHIAKSLNIEINHRTVVRVKNTIPQTELDAKERVKNLKDAFAIGAELNSDHVAILDDVITTGVTTKTIYHLLKQRYPDTHIEVWCMGLTLLR